MPTHSRITHRSNLLVFAALLALAGSSYALSFAPLGALSVPAAMLISLAKATLVLIFFMELVAQRFLNRFVVVAALLLACTLLALVGADVLTRATPPMLSPRSR